MQNDESRAGILTISEVVIWSLRQELIFTFSDNKNANSNTKEVKLPMKIM
jgi:hypothetical protein